MKTIKIKIKGKTIEVEPRKVGEDRDDYRQYLEDCYRMKFPYIKYRKFRIIKRIRQFDLQEKSLDKMERKSYNYTFKKTGVNFDGPDYLIRALFGGSNEKRKETKENEKAERKAKRENKKAERKAKKENKKAERKAKKENKKENKFIGFFKNFFSRKDKDVEADELEETFDEVFDENIHEDDMILEENIREEDKPKAEKNESKIPTSLPIEIKSSRDLNKEEVNNMSVMAQLRYLQEQNKKQAEIINSTINNFNVYLENFKKLEQENLRLRKEITRLSYNPNSFVIKNAYEEAIKEEQIRKLQSIHNSFVNSNKDYIHDDLTANQYNVDKVKVLTRK